MFHCVLQSTFLGKNAFIKGLAWTAKSFSKIYLFIIYVVISLEKDPQSNMAEQDSLSLLY